MEPYTRERLGVIQQVNKKLLHDTNGCSASNGEK